MNSQRILLALLVIGLLTQCSKGESNSEGGNPFGAPDAANLVFPDNNLECTEGSIVNDAQSTVTFRWDEAANTDSYELNLKNLNTNTSAITTSNTNESTITLERGMPYEWYVTSISSDSDQTAKSDTWKFYNQGPGVTNYAPFPANAVNPTRGQTVSAGSINLEWEGDDVDNDITEFEVLFGTNNNPTSSLGTTSQSSFSTNINSGQTYYWRVISRDRVGNTSQSEIFNFRVQ